MFTKVHFMKAFLSFFLLAFSTASFAQIAAPSLDILIEEVTIPSGVFEPSSTPYRTFRLYAQIDPNWEMLSIFGLLGSPLSLNTNGDFYQDPLGGPTTLDITNELLVSNPSLNYDSWFTIGAESSLENLIFVAPIGGSFFNNWEAGGNLLIDDIIGGLVGIPSPGSLTQNVADENGRILFAQLTANDDISGCLNMQFRLLNEDGSLYIQPGGGTVAEIFYDVCFNIPFTNLCPSDFNSSGVVDVADLLILVSNYGCTSGCIADVTGDDYTSSGDLLTFLSELGQVCNPEE